MIPPKNDKESDYDWGYRVGFAKTIIHYDDLRHYSPGFIRGYNRGRMEIEAHTDEV